ncbi:MAG TPA: RHS repeat-associated core domain-containing protein [Firmicutes bacterium]|nr:RHS repeat-associated core domain-containing protein [Bacillota bacterium]
MLDSNGNIVVEYKYDSWANHAVLDANGADIASATHIGNLNPFRYRGYYYDTETGLYFLKTRYYDPEVGRFITIDDISYIDPETINGLNLYAYCGNNPVMRVDENGNSWWDSFWKGLVAVAVAVVVVAVVAAITVATGGAAAPVLIGAAIGFGVNFGSSALTQFINTGTVDWGQALLSGAIGGVLGAFGGTAIGQLGMTGVTFGVEFVGSYASDWIAGTGFDFREAFSAAVFSAGFAFFGGGGAQNGILPARRNALASKQAILKKNAAGGYTLAGFKGGLSSNARAIARLDKKAIFNILKGIPLGVFSSLFMGGGLNKNGFFYTFYSIRGCSNIICMRWNCSLVFFKEREFC